MVTLFYREERNRDFWPSVVLSTRDKTNSCGFYFEIYTLGVVGDTEVQMANQTINYSFPVTTIAIRIWLSNRPN